MKLDELFERLDTIPRPILLSPLKHWLRQIDLKFRDFEPYVKFSEQNYQRNLMKQGLEYHALVLCWRNGQRSFIHNHKGSACAVRVIKGAATESFFDIGDNGLIFPVRSCVYREGQVIGSNDADIHQISNLQADDKDLITLHIYTPPLLSMDCYSLENNAVKTVTDPVFGLTGEGI